MKSIFYALAIFGLVGLVYSCQELEPVNYFYDSDLLQDWALLAQTDQTDPNLPKLRCEALYVYKEDDSYYITGNGIRIETGRLIPNWTHTGEELKPGNFFFRSKVYGDFYLTVIGKTGNAVVLYSCQFPLMGVPHVWVYYKDYQATWNRIPENEKIAIVNSLRRHSIGTDTLKYSDNSLCS